VGRGDLYRRIEDAPGIYVMQVKENQAEDRKDEMIRNCFLKLHKLETQTSGNVKLFSVFDPRLIFTG